MKSLLMGKETTENYLEILNSYRNIVTTKNEHIKKLCNCTDYDIDLLISKKMLVRESESKIIRYQGKQINNRKKSLEFAVNFCHIFRTLFFIG